MGAVEPGDSGIIFVLLAGEALRACLDRTKQRRVAVLRGSAPSDAACDWLDDSTLFVQLTMLTAATGGMTL